MGALVFPIVAIVVLLLLWFAFATRKARQQAAADEVLPDDPVQRRNAERALLEREHAESDPALTRHPARRP